MEFIKLILGIGLVVVFIWVLMKNSNRTSFINALLRVDTAFGIIAGIYLVFSATYSLLAQ